MLLTLALAMNDAEIVGVGGAASTLGGGSKVQMLSERVEVYIPQGEVITKFQFKNHGGPTTVTMGFPENGDNATPDEENPTFFTYFRSFVDGKETPVRAQKVAIDDMQYSQWWVKQVRFSAGQTRTVRNAYKAPAGGSANGFDFFTYVLETGRSWHLPIGEATIVVDVSGLKKGTKFTAIPAGYTRKGSRLVWRWKDFEPASAMNVHVHWQHDNYPFPVDDESFATMTAAKKVEVR